MLKSVLMISVLCFGINLLSQARKGQLEDFNVFIDLEENENYTARHECSFVQVGEEFIMFGGRESSQQLDVYDYKNNTWRQGGKAPKEFNHFQATSYEGYLWVIGAFKTNNFPREIPEDNIWLYHPLKEKWIKGPEILENRRRGGAGLVIKDDVFYLVGGNTDGHHGGFVSWFDSYDPNNNKWTVLQDAWNARDHFHAAIIGDSLYAAGGRHSGGEGGVFAPLVTAVDVFDFKTQSWSTLNKDLPTGRAAPGTAVFNGELYIMGGEGSEKGPAYKIVEAYNPATQQWTQKAKMNHARHGTQSIVSGDGIFIAAGSPSRGGGRQKNMEVFGENAPVGDAILSSILKSEDIAEMKVGSYKNIFLENTVGNMGIFIESIVIEGEGKEQFHIVKDISKTLIKAGNVSNALIRHSGSKAGKATLKINYDGGEKKLIILKAKS